MKSTSLIRAALGVLTLSFLTLSASAADGEMLAQRHTGRGLQCTVCHDAAGSPKLRENGDYGICASCHGDYQKMIDKTAEKLKNSGQPNPHAQHDGALPCTECHKGHSKGVSYCSQCHSFTYAVP